MKFTKFNLVSVGLITVPLPLIGALPSDPYILKNVDGLGPPPVDISIVNSTLQAGVYQGRRPQNRELVFRVGLNPDYGINQTSEELRDDIYGLLTPGLQDRVDVQVMNGSATIPVAVTSGYVSKIDPVLFAQEPEVQITLDCVEPYFHANSETILGTLDKAVPKINNIGNAPTGFRMDLTFTANVTNWILARQGAAAKRMKFELAFLIGDQLQFDTRPGQRFINLIRGGKTLNRIDILSSDSLWQMLHGGVNTWTTSSASFTWNRISYTPQYWGL